MTSLKFGGLDLALRVDNTAFICLELNKGVLEEIGQRVWPHIEFSRINKELLSIQRHEKMRAVGYDRLGVGDGAKELFSKELPLRDIVSSLPNKLDMISLVQGLFDQKKLIIHSQKLYQEITEQEKKVTDAGNITYQHPTGFHDDRFWALCYACAVASYAIAGVARPKIAHYRKRNPLLEDLIERDMQYI